MYVWPKSEVKLFQSKKATDYLPVCVMHFPDHTRSIYPARPLTKP